MVIETIPDDTIIIKIPIQFNSAKTLHELSSMDGVRWAGELPIAWRVSSEVIFNCWQGCNHCRS